MRFKNVVWDWNGTLLDDMSYCLRLTNRLLTARGLAPLKGLEEYRERFFFPVKKYYASLGIGPDQFTEAANIWMDAYMADETVCPLQPGAAEVTGRLRDLKIRQVIISASKLEHLVRQLDSRPCIRDCCPCYGIGDIFAKEKQTLALQVLERLGWIKGETVFIGDTLHDAEVASAAGCACILVANGHQSRERLLGAGVPVCDDLEKAEELLLA